MDSWKRIMMLTLLMLVLGPGAAVAQTPKIGFVNVARLLSESPQAKASMEALREEFAPRERDLLALATELKEKEEQLQRDQEVMGPEERQNAQNEMRKAQREVARGREELSEDFNLRRNEELGKLQRELMRQVQTFAQQSGYDLVVSDGVLYASQGVDITQEILAGLENSYQSVGSP